MTDFGAGIEAGFTPRGRSLLIQAAENGGQISKKNAFHVEKTFSWIGYLKTLLLLIEHFGGLHGIRTFAHRESGDQTYQFD